jgi:hypothetical protein
MGSLTTASERASTSMGESSTASGYISTAIGFGSTASGYISTAMGNMTIASGGNSTSMGRNSIASGGASTAMGLETRAIGDNSVSMGYSTKAEGHFSTAMGSGTTAEGQFSTAMGYSTITKGDASTAMGSSTISTGNSSVASGLNTIASGEESFTMGRGTISKPFALLAIGQYNDTTTSFSTSGWDLRDPVFVIGNGSSHESRSNIFTVLKSGNTAIGHASPTQMLDVNGNARFRNIGSDAYVGAVNIASDGTLTTATSDVRLKDNISTLTNSLNAVLNLRGISFTWKNEPEMGSRIGFVAQEVEPVLPELVFTNPADGLKGVNYAEMTAVLVEAVKEQQKQIDELRALVNSLIANQTGRVENK